jgi:ATP-binding cassette subfamily B protein
MFLLRCAGVWLDEYVRSALENSFKRRLFRNLLYKDYARVSAYHSGEWMTRMTSDTNVVAGGVAHILPGLSGTVIRMISAVVMLFRYVPQLTGWVLCGGVVIILFTWVLRKMVKKLHRQVQMSDSRFRIFMTERLSSMMVIRAFEKEEVSLQQGQERMADHKKARMRKTRVMGLFHNGFSLMVNCVYVAGAIYCARGIYTGIMDYGTFTAVIQLISQVQSPIGNISGYFTQYSTMLASAERLMEVECFSEERATAAVEDIPRFYREEFESIGLTDAAFTYAPVSVEAGEEERRRVLRGLNLEIPKGQYVAFCGPSGCGKSTVLKLLMCMYELDEGKGFIRSRKGEYPLSGSWRGLFSYVPQGNQLMSGTIREVVTFGEGSHSLQDEKIYQALDIACAEFVRELPEGLNTTLGERGAGLSEGQMQRIAIARAVFSNRPVMLLDEATSALDELTETRLLQNLKAMTNKTVIIVTHRPAALEITDQIIHFQAVEE